MLRFLGTERAIDEMIARYDEEPPGCGFESMAGLFGAPDRERVVRRLEAGLRANDQPISDAYLRSLALLSVYEQQPMLRPAQTRDTNGRLTPSGEAGRLRDLVDAAKAMYTEVLDAALPEKTARARARILSSRLEAAPRADPALPAPSATSRDRLREQLAASFLELSAERQTDLLEFQWPSLAGPAMVPVLRSLVATSTVSSSSLADRALRRLYELAPGEGRARILREIRNPSRGATLMTLGMLPDRELPELDDVLAANVETTAGDLSIRAELLHRYGSPAVSVRVLSAVDDRLTRMACQPQAAFLAYFVRAEPELGTTLLNRALASRGLTGCYKSALRDVATLRMTAGVEAAAVAHLDDPDPQVVTSAAETLGRHGSQASAPSLRAQFERWHRTGAERQEELRRSRAQGRPDSMQGMVEFTFLQALGRGQAWLTDAADLRDLRALCVTDHCRTQADHMIDASDETRITIARIDNPDNAVVMLAHYQLSSIRVHPALAPLRPEPRFLRVLQRVGL